MAEDHKDRLPHLLLHETASTERYTRPRTRGPEFKPPPRTRAQHAESLLQQFETARAQEADIVQEQKAFGLDVGYGLNGTYLSQRVRYSSFRRTTPWMEEVRGHGWAKVEQRRSSCRE